MSISVPDPTTFDAASFAAQALSSPAALAAVLDHTLLKPDATRTQVLAICEEAAKYKFACAMVNPFWTGTAAAALKGTGVPVGVVIGFPLGATLTASKKEEAGRVLALGAHDVDMVLNIGLLKSGEFDAVKHDIHIVAEVVHAHGGILKVILETCLLSFEDKMRASELAIEAGADFIKTSTGFSTGGATVDDIQLMRGVAGIRCGVKASGGIRSLADAQAMLFAGATRIGASASVRIVNELANPTDAAAVPTAGY
ncbi:deoxyribose-phosphate aldolase [Terriglobus albidus]|uniref:Deoxyribose-phosphate aldolase n=1 Tax=Terriglobus albidus TaxID=1592106 RepID=A0A5B9EBA5_9BACT|nr:deoxyribose-phosphate aldolase [Terriglobus albidus]QEE29059.1 deoxyribose-phosphate aldolase [Terriglobus albidus]